MHAQLTNEYRDRVATDPDLEIILVEYPNGGDYFLPFGYLAVGACHMCYQVHTS